MRGLKMKLKHKRLMAVILSIQLLTVGLSTDIQPVAAEKAEAAALTDYDLYLKDAGFPDATAEYTANGSVLVFPLIFPAIIAVAPNTPSPLANASTPPEMIPGSAFGIITRKKMLHSLIPSVLPAESTSGFTCSKAPLADRYINGNEITTAANTVAPHENAIFTAKYSIKNLPIGLLIPKI